MRKQDPRKRDFLENSSENADHLLSFSELFCVMNACCTELHREGTENHRGLYFAV